MVYNETPTSKENAMNLFIKAVKGYFLTLAFAMIVILGFVAFLQLLLTPIG